VAESGEVVPWERKRGKWVTGAVVLDRGHWYRGFGIGIQIADLEYRIVDLDGKRYVDKVG
jgi:hypothetical protein